jgi:hypothetical protein
MLVEMINAGQLPLDAEQGMVLIVTTPEITVTVDGYMFCEVGAAGWGLQVQCRLLAAGLELASQRLQPRGLLRDPLLGSQPAAAGGAGRAAAGAEKPAQGRPPASG